MINFYSVYWMHWADIISKEALKCSTDLKNSFTCYIDKKLEHWIFPEKWYHRSNIKSSNCKFFREAYWWKRSSNVQINFSWVKKGFSNFWAWKQTKNIIEIERFNCSTKCLTVATQQKFYKLSTIWGERVWLTVMPACIVCMVVSWKRLHGLLSWHIHR